MNRQETAKLVAVMVAATAQGAKLDGRAVEGMIDAYSGLLADLDYEACDAAVRVLLQSKPFIPAVADIRSAVLELKHGPVRTGADAWGDLRKLQTPRDRAAMALVDPIVLYVCQSYGWIEWRTLWRNGEDIEQWHVVTSEKNEASDRARFIELYDSTVSQYRREVQVPILAAAREARGAKSIAEAVQAALSSAPAQLGSGDDR